jgi:hypothetical protein
MVSGSTSHYNSIEPETPTLGRLVNAKSLHTRQFIFWQAVPASLGSPIRGVSDGIFWLVGWSKERAVEGRLASAKLSSGSIRE